MVGLREDLAQAHTSKSEVAEALQKAVSDLAAAQGSHEDMRKVKLFNIYLFAKPT